MTVPEPSIGALLRSAREAAGLTVEQVSATTRIRAQLVRDLEADRLDSSGGAVYARGHVRALARAAGVDPGPLVARLDEALGESVPALAPTVALQAPHPVAAGRIPVAAAPERTGPRWAPAAVAAAVVLVALFAAGSWRGEAGDDSDGLALATTGTPADAPAPPPAAQPPPPAPPAPPAGAELTLRLAGGASWISVRDGAQTLFEGEVADGWTETFRDDAPLRVRVGNAAAVHVVCAGVDAGPAGGAGEVRTLVCAHEGLSAARP